MESKIEELLSHKGNPHSNVFITYDYVADWFAVYFVDKYDDDQKPHFCYLNGDHSLMRALYFAHKTMEVQDANDDR